MSASSINKQNWSRSSNNWLKLSHTEPRHITPICIIQPWYSQTSAKSSVHTQFTIVTTVYTHQQEPNIESSHTHTSPPLTEISLLSLHLAACALATVCRHVAKQEGDFCFVMWRSARRGKPTSPLSHATNTHAVIMNPCREKSYVYYHRSGLRPFIAL